MRRATAISLVGHGAILAWALISFARPFEPTTTEMFPVDVLTATEFNKVAAGDLKAPISETPKPVVDKIAEPTPPPEDPNAKVDKKDITASTDKTDPEPPPPPKPVEKKEPEKKVDPIAEALKKEETKKPEKKVEKPLEKKPEIKERTFDKRQIADLLDKKKPTRVAAAGPDLNNVVSRGAPKGSAPTLTANELALIQRRLTQNWNTNGIDMRGIVVEINIRLRIDGSLAVEPEIATRERGPRYEAAIRSARAAVMRSVPFEFLLPSRFEHWEKLELNFVPEQM
jgi:outer membrane biosynthesis protein TonB